VKSLQEKTDTGFDREFTELSMLFLTRNCILWLLKSDIDEIYTNETQSESLKPTRINFGWQRFMDGRLSSALQQAIPFKESL